jgi:hypothetical protein
MMVELQVCKIIKLPGMNIWAAAFVVPGHSWPESLQKRQANKKSNYQRNLLIYK